MPYTILWTLCLCFILFLIFRCRFAKHISRHVRNSKKSVQPNWRIPTETSKRHHLNRHHHHATRIRSMVDRAKIATLIALPKSVNSWTIQVVRVSDVRPNKMKHVAIVRATAVAVQVRSYRLMNNNHPQHIQSQSIWMRAPAARRHTVRTLNVLSTRKQKLTLLFSNQTIQIARRVYFRHLRNYPRNYRRNYRVNGRHNHRPPHRVVPSWLWI